MKPSCLLFLIAFGIIGLSSLSWAGSVEIVTFSYPPYMNESGEGLMKEIFDATFKNSGSAYSFKVYPRKRAIILFNHPEIQGLFLGERSYFPDMTGLETKTLLTFKTVFVYLKNRYPQLNYTGLSDLKGKRVGVSMGSVLTPVFKKHGMMVDEALLENNITKLMTKRIDFWHTVDTSALRLIARKYPDQEKDFGFIPDQTHTVDLVVKKGSLSEPEFRIFVKRFDTLVKNGGLHNIVKHFLEKNQL